MPIYYTSGRDTAQTSHAVVVTKNIQTRVVGARHKDGYLYKQTYLSARQSREYLEAVGHEAVAQIRPLRIDPLLDQIQYRVLKPWDDRRRDEFGARYGTPIHVAKDEQGNPLPPMLVRGQWYQQCLHADQPTWEFIAALDKFSPFLNQVECALEYIFSSPQELTHAEEVFDRYAIKKNSGGQNLRYATRGKKTTDDLPRRRDKGLVTRYIGDRRSGDGRVWDGNVLVQYSRVPKLDPSADDFALHIEWVVSGPQALGRIGVHEILDLLTLDRYAFFKPRLRLAEIDRVTLARLWRNKLAGHHVWCEYPVDNGEVLYRAAQTSLHPFQGSFNSQNVIARYSKTDDGKPFIPVVSRCLIEFPVEHLLPSPGSFLRRLEPFTATTL